MYHSDFRQPAPRAGNRFRTDPALRLSLERHLPPDIMAEASPLLDRLGERAASELPALADLAEANPPRHTQYDAWGNRIDRIETDPAFSALIRIGQEEGLVALPYEAQFGSHARVIQAGLANLFDPVSAVATCPLVMTDGAAWLLRTHDPALWAKYGPRLTARHGAITSGQWMTETAGGSDVGQTATIADPQPDGGFALRGIKYFTSATSADIALVLARPHEAAPGSAGLSLFLLEPRAPDGSWNGIAVRRLKDKMGTRALPTAELELQGARAVPVGGLGRGVAKVASLLNIARVWAAYAAPAGTGHLLALARDYARNRRVFGHPLADQPMHRAWLARIAAEYEAMLALCFETAAALGRAEHGGNAGMARLLAPLTKLLCARQGIWGTSELIESFGGAGYIEDTGLPRIFRNAHVHAIWEGTTSVLAHDVLRALRDRDLALEWREDIHRRLADIVHPELACVTPRIEAALETLRPMTMEPDPDDGRRLAIGMARVTQAALLCQAAEWRIVKKNDRAALIAAEMITREPLLPAVCRDMQLDQLAWGAMPEAQPA
jgi:alkylation response protein AidB-like acyl-CoA dehydrogenase